MNLATFERAQVAAFAYQQARHTGSLDCMKAICHVLRNRVRAGWGDGTWTTIINLHSEVEGNLQTGKTPIDPNDRLLHLLVRDIDDIYLGMGQDETKIVVQDALYFQFIDQPVRVWFVDHIVQDQENHPRVAHVGPLALFK